MSVAWQHDFVSFAKCQLDYCRNYSRRLERSSQNMPELGDYKLVVLWNLCVLDYVYTTPERNNAGKIYLRLHYAVTVL